MEKQKRIPRRRFREFLEAGEWEYNKASNVFESISDKNHAELPVLSATQDKGMVLRDTNGINIQHDEKSELTYKRVLPGQFVIHLRSFQGGFAHSNVEGITSPAYTVIDFKNNEHNDYFWKYIFMSEEFIKRLETVTYGIRDGRSISYDDFSTLSFVFPNKSEQEKIGNFCRRLDTLISLHQQKLSKLKDLKQAYLTEMFPAPGEKRPRRRFKGFSGDWEEYTLGKLCNEFHSGKFIPANKVYDRGLYPVYGGNGLRGYTDSFNHDGEYALIGRQGALCGNMNYSKGKAYFTEHAVAIKANDTADTLFLYYLCGLMNLGQYSGQSAQPGLAVSNIILVAVLVPKRDEQIAIGSFFQHLDEVIFKQENKLAKLQSLKQAYLSELFV